MMKSTPRNHSKGRKPVEILVIILLACGWPGLSWGQALPDTGAVKSPGAMKGRLTGVAVTASTLYLGSMTGLYSLWYADYPQSSFHFINDCNEWMGADKAGHTVTSYWVGKIGYESLRWAGMDHKKALWYGGMWGFVFLATVEVFDGFSAEWGASLCDIAANGAGTALFIGQELLWKKQPFVLKFSYHPTDYAQYRPDLLGSNAIQRVIKDYNGQTFWLSGNIASFLPPSSKFPRWISVSLGYSAEGMIGAGSNPVQYQGQVLPGFERYPRFFLSLDADLTKIRTRSETLKLLFNLIGFIKIPFPALEYNPREGWCFHPIYF